MRHSHLSLASSHSNPPPNPRLGLSVAHSTGSRPVALHLPSPGSSAGFHLRSNLRLHLKVRLTSLLQSASFVITLGIFSSRPGRIRENARYYSTATTKGCISTCPGTRPPAPPPLALVPAPDPDHQHVEAARKWMDLKNMYPKNEREKK